jgi:hypothetical protein
VDDRDLSVFLDDIGRELSEDEAAVWEGNGVLECDGICSSCCEDGCWLLAAAEAGFETRGPLQEGDGLADYIQSLA